MVVQQSHRLGIVATARLSVASLVACLVFFRYYDAFRRGCFLGVLIVLLAIISYVTVLGFVPYDISLRLFGSTPVAHQTLRTTLEVFY
jgi:hypothetical protein